MSWRSSDTNEIPDDDPVIGCDDIDASAAINEQLRAENENLKDQVSRALDFQKDVEALHEENRALSSQLVDSRQKKADFQKRLQIAQKKIKESEDKAKRLEEKIREMWSEKDESVSKCRELEGRRKTTDQKMSNLASENERLSDDLQSVVSIISRLAKSEVTNLADVESFAKRFETAAMAAEEMQNASMESEEDAKAALMFVCRENKKLKAALKTRSQVDDGKKKAAMKRLVKESEVTVNEYEARIEELVAHIEALTADNDKAVDVNHELVMRLDQLRNDREEDIARYKEAMASNDQRILQLKKVLSNPDRSNAAETDNFVRELSAKKQECEKIEEQLGHTRAGLASAQKKLSAANEKNESLRRGRKQMKKHYHTLSEAHDNMKKTMEASVSRKEALEQELAECQKENNALREQMKATVASHNEEEATWNEKIHEQRQVQAAVDSLENAMDRQRDEIASMTADRARMIELLHKQSQLILGLEAEATSRYTAERGLRCRVRQLEKVNRANSENGKSQSVDIIATLTDSLISKAAEPQKQRMLEMVRDQRVPVLQRVQHVIEDAGSVFEVARVDPGSHKVSVAEKGKCERLETVIRALFTSFRNMLSGNKADSLCTDTEFIEFLTSHCIRLDAVLRENEILAPQFMAMDFLFSGSMDDRRRAIEQLAASGWDAPLTFDMFCAQALTNIAQGREIETLKNLLTDRSAQLESLQSTLGCDDAGSVHECFELVSRKMKKLKDQNRKLQKFKNAALREEMERMPPPELEQEVESLQETVTTLEDNLRIVVADATSLQRELDIKTQQVVSLEKYHGQLAEESTAMHNKHLAEVCQFESLVDARNREVRELSVNLNQTRADAEQQISSLRQANESLRKKLAERTEKAKKSMTLLQQKRKNTEQQMLNSLKAKDRQSEEAIRQANAANDEMKTRMSESVDRMSRQVTEQTDLTERLTASLGKSEQRNKQMTSEISKLSIAKKTLEVQLKSLNDQMHREVQIIGSQASIRAMNDETRHQDELNRVRSALSKEKSDLMTSLLADFDELDQFDDEDIDELSFKAIMEQIARNVRTQKKNGSTAPF